MTTESDDIATQSARALLQRARDSMIREGWCEDCEEFKTAPGHRLCPVCEPPAKSVSERINADLQYADQRGIPETTTGADTARYTASPTTARAALPAHGQVLGRFALPAPTDTDSSTGDPNA